MALELKMLIELHIQGSNIYTTDKTGEQSADNEGGWGAPNQELNQTALMCIVTYTSTSETTLEMPASNHIVYDPTATNDKETSFDYVLEKDGYHTIYLLALGVSVDGNNYITGSQILANEYFYQTDGTIYQKQADGSNRQVVDELELVDSTNANRPTQAYCEKLLTPNLRIMQGELYNEYRKNRGGGCAKDHMHEALDLLLDISGANAKFYQGLQMEAQEIIEKRNEQYETMF